MIRTFTWEMRTNEEGYKNFRDILVPSFNTENNGLVCSLLKEGWEVIKIKIRHENQHAYYHYCFGKPDLRTEMGN